ncbi:MAG: hypothetical protein ACREPM_05625 [Gemmatimonadaceae bacterium]
MAQLTHRDYEALERAIVEGKRVAIRRPGRREHIVIPLRLSLIDGHEVIEAKNSTTGDAMRIDLGDVEHLEVVR